mmetsp:Transcript_2063/g.6188  ORF Transcript_2063/g.6188 Transcript_2063/m.6188 type:complete len:202 (-) Transcript_2063:116-721(-)
MSLLPAPFSTVTEVPRSGGGPRRARALARCPRGALALGRLRRPPRRSLWRLLLHPPGPVLGEFLVGGGLIPEDPEHEHAVGIGGVGPAAVQRRGVLAPALLGEGARKPSERHAAPVGEAQGPQQEPQLRRPGLLKGLRRRPARQQLHQHRLHLPPGRQIQQHTRKQQLEGLERVALLGERVGRQRRLPALSAGSSVRGGRW